MAKKSTIHNQWAEQISLPFMRSKSFEKEKIMAVTEVKIWLLRRGITPDEIMKEYGCKRSFVSEYVNGHRTSEPMAAYLIQKGCPRKHFKNGRVIA